MFVFVIIVTVFSTLNAECPSLRAPENGFMVSDDQTACGTEVGSVCKLNCLRNYRIAGDSERVCLRNGEWSGKQGTCIDPSVRCLPPLIPPKNGFIDGECVNWGGFSCIFACDDGYEISGSVRVTCDRNSRRWSSATPTCVRETITCPALEAPENGVIGGDCDGMNSFTGARCRFACNPGYELEGTKSLTCQANGLWNGYVPVCVAHVVTCRPLRAPPNGYTSGACDNSPPQNSRCTFHCNSGYELEGSQVLICSSDGRWNSVAPKCVRRVTSCRELKRPENGDFRCQQAPNIGAHCTFRCRSGFELEGRRVLICQSNGSWDGEEPVCTASSPTCSALDRPQFGRHNGSCGEGTAVGASCTFFCNSGYRLNGSKRLVCQPDGSWDNESPVCVPDVAKCPTLLAPINGSIKGACSLSSAPAGSLCMFSCIRGFKLRGEEILKCLPNGQWNGTAPKCIAEIVTCLALRPPLNGKISANCSSKAVAGSQCKYSCDSGYTLKGSEILTCMTNGNWDEAAPKCIQEQQDPTCPALDAPERGAKAGACFEGARVGASCAFKCDDGYELSGKESLVCQADGSWDDEVPTCQEEPKNCPSIRSIVGGTATGDCDPGVNNRLCAFSCNRGYYLIGTPALLCKDGIWSSRSPICRRSHRGGCRLPVLPNGAIISYCSTLVGGRCYYACRYSSIRNRAVDNMRNINSLPRDVYSVCQTNGRWRGRLISCRPGISWILGFPFG